MCTSYHYRLIKYQFEQNFGPAKVPALLRRLGRVPYDRTFGVLIVHFLSIKKSLTTEKSDCHES